MKTVYEFYMECDLLPISARVNLYNACTRKRIVENYQNLKNNKYDELLVDFYKWNPKTNLLMLFVC